MKLTYKPIPLWHNAEENTWNIIFKQISYDIRIDGIQYIKDKIQHIVRSKKATIDTLIENKNHIRYSKYSHINA